MITPDSPERVYSTRLRTAVVLTGSGTAGAYHAGVLRALHEAGVRTDIVAGRGMGAATAMFAAIDGGPRLWDATGVWKGRAPARFYSWRAALRVAGWSLVAAAAVLLFPLLLLASAIVIGTIAFLLTLVGLGDAGSVLTVGFTSRITALFAPASLPTTVPRLVLLGVLIAVASLGVSVAARQVASRGRRRTRGDLLSPLWRLIGSPLTAAHTLEALAAELWKLIKGAAPLQQPRNAELGRRYVELLSENLGQPGFRELLVVLHDLDARQDLVFAFLAGQHRPRFFGRLVSGGPAARISEAFDLSGVARDHAMDVLSAALAMPIATEPHLVAFAAEGPWRGETHRMCDRPGALGRVLEEVAAAGAEQVILLSASPRSARPHELSSGPADLRGRAGEQLGAFECAGLRDAIEQFAGRFAGLHVIRPEHNPLGPFDFSGIHDQRSDRRYTLAELVDRGYEDAYRQFIDPVVGASGERVE
ncbi:MAG: patatin-like phospholipase family protein, partial [Burkholderiales bacterium]